ncbi:MAG TPA: TIGR03619 family F420-dependent LLM class oxidoreductase, partial [Rhodopila sp.]
MQIGFNLPVSGPMASPEVMANIAQLGESLGFDYLTLTDHVALPDTTSPGYPYSTTGEFYTPDPGHRVEQLTTAAWVAAKTSKIRLVLAVMVVPHRPAVVTSKMLATIDVLSGGRLVVGIGAGWLKVELDAVSTTPFAERGAVTDEYMDAMRTIWTQDKPVFHGKYVHIDGLLTDPKPLQKPHPPIWVGGESGPSMRRAARIGDAWYPIGSNNAHLLDTLPRLTAGIARIRDMTKQAGRDPTAMGVVYR